MASSTQDRSLGELFAELARESGTLVRQEVELAKTEMTEKASRTIRHVGFLAVGGAVAYAGLLAILAAVVIVLAALGLPWWQAALLVGAVVAGIGYYLIRQGLAALKRADLTPRQTMQTLKDDVDWAKDEVA